MSYQTIILEKKDNIALLTMNTPESLNALSGKTIDELTDALAEIEGDDAIKVIIMTGSGKAFVAGGDIAYMKAMEPKEAIKFSYDTQSAFRKIAESHKTFIAAINGLALGGGCELAMACDIRLAADTVKLGLPEVSLGIIPGGGGTQRMPLLVGMAKAKELILTGTAIKADEAQKIGLVNKVIPKENLMEEAYLMAKQIIKNAPIAVAYAKECVNMSVEANLNAGLEFEKNMFGLCFATQDQKNGMAAFLEKKEVVFKGE